MKLLALLHRWTGGFVGLLLAVIGLSGTILVWEGAWIALPGADDPVTRDASALGASIETALAVEEGLTRITFAGDEIGLHMASYADGSGAYIAQDGTLVQRWDTMWGRPELWLFDLHHYLLMGELGKYVTGTLGLLMFAFSVTGLVLWWRTRRTFAFRLWPKRLTKSAIVRQHRDIGAVASPLLLLSALTGSMMIFPAISDALTAPWDEPGHETSSPLPPAGGAGGGPAAPDWTKLMASAQATFPDAWPRRLMFPATPGAPLALRMKQDFEWTPNGRTYVWLDPTSAAVVAVDDPATGNPADAIAETWYPLHSGKVGGVLWQLALTFGGLVLVLLGTLATWSFWFGGAKAKPAVRGGERVVAAE